MLGGVLCALCRSSGGVLERFWGGWKLGGDGGDGAGDVGNKSSLF